jgi:hypothetical protein
METKPTTNQTTDVDGEPLFEFGPAFYDALVEALIAHDLEAALALIRDQYPWSSPWHPRRRRRKKLPVPDQIPGASGASDQGGAPAADGMAGGGGSIAAPGAPAAGTAGM